MTIKNGTSSEVLQSGIYQGWVRHRRYLPNKHAFKYHVFMMYIDLDELDSILSMNPLWSDSFFSPICFRREDYFGDPDIPLDIAVKQKVAKEIDFTPNGAVRILTNLRFFGFIINPITVYYCFDLEQRLQAMMLDVTNTPWRESHQYVIQCDPNKKKQRKKFHKEHHVSPFQPMNMQYDWFSNIPGNKLVIHMNNTNTNSPKERAFDATLALKHRSISRGALFAIILKYPMMTFKVFAAIYWQAVKLYIKKTPFYSHPKRKPISP